MKNVYTYMHGSWLSSRLNADRPRRALLFAQLSIKPENQQAHDQRREHEDERSHQIPVDSLRVADSGHGAVTGTE